MSGRDGSAKRLERRQYSRRKSESSPLSPTNGLGRSRGQCRARAVRRRRDQWSVGARLSQRKKCRSKIDDGHVRRVALEHRQLALVGRADLHARRETIAQVGHRDLRAFQKSADGLVQQRHERLERAGDSNSAGRRNFVADAGENAGNQFPDRTG